MRVIGRYAKPARAAGSGVRPGPRFAAAVDGFIERLHAVAPLRRQVREGLAGIADMGIPVTVVTEGWLERCRHLLDVHGLSSLVGEVISARKTADALRALKRAAAEKRTLMVGDQLDRDIGAAHDAGFMTFYFPSGFVPYWSTDADRVADHEISRYDEIVPLLGQAATACRAGVVSSGRLEQQPSATRRRKGSLRRSCQDAFRSSGSTVAGSAWAR
jgi:phosphoglycolate phosphatase-like HAD superfamily hydrolase